jgi:hypothetical protein
MKASESRKTIQSWEVERAAPRPATCGGGRGERGEGSRGGRAGSRKGIGGARGREEGNQGWEVRDREAQPSLPLLSPLVHRHTHAHAHTLAPLTPPSEARLPCIPFPHHPHPPPPHLAVGRVPRPVSLVVAPVPAHVALAPVALKPVHEEIVPVTTRVPGQGAGGRAGSRGGWGRIAGSLGGASPARYHLPRRRSPFTPIALYTAFPSHHFLFTPPSLHTTVSSPCSSTPPLHTLRRRL